MDISGLFIFPLFWFLKYRPVAQLVEHRSPKPEVGGSSPSWPARIKIMVANKLDTETNKNDLIKWILASLIFVSSLAAFYYLDQYPLVYRILGLVGVVFLDFFILFNTEKIKNLRVFTYDARVELKKVVWSTKAEVVQTTIIVFVVVIIMSVLLWLLDKLLGAGIKFLLA
tara:strand:+ start:300 stop:809 length:510 start_codon:yes stop_codon:yes gene_type:complete